MKFNRVNNIVGWIVGLAACTVFVMTAEATGSFWDCGEFISSCYKIQIPHPPGAPLFVLMGRFFIILFGDSPHTAARAVNFMSAIASGLSILFLFWSITHFARRIVQKDNYNAEPNRRQVFTIMACGVVGALAYAFTDSFWYSAVEGEVYASSAFFTALVFWAILKWERQADKPGADRWIVFIFYMMGLSIGVHLLNLLTIPAIVMVYYFRRYKPTIWGTIIAFVIGCAITGIVQKFVIQYTIKGAMDFDIFFVNSMNMPFFVGFGFFFVALTAVLVTINRWAVRKRWYYLKMAVWCAGFMLLGYSTYFTTMIRSNADPGVDMYNVDNPVALEGYLSREQYGDWPILYGPDFEDQAPDVDEGPLFVKGKDRYEVAGKVVGKDWVHTPSSHLFPRMWDPGNDRDQRSAYLAFSGMEEGNNNPTMLDNIKYFIAYQNWEMFLRYFFWNYSGKQNDVQGFGNIRDGNAITGIPFLDNWFLKTDQSKLPDSIHTNNKSYNRMFLLPVILGLIGLFLQVNRNRRDFLITLLLFFFTGFAIVIYLNQAGFQPRERDYAFAGACYAFAIWIGLGVIKVEEWFGKLAFKGRADLAGYAAAGLCFLAVPVLMGSQEWDDHDRSHKTLPRDIGKDYLESCPKNALLFAFGDNDTYPLWYAQEVEGIRPDVRVMNYSLLGESWYLNQLRYKVNESGPFDVLFTPEQIQGTARDAIVVNPIRGFDQNNYYDAYTIFKDVVGSDDPQFKTQLDDGQLYNILPVRHLSVPVDTGVVRANGTVNPGDSVISELHIDIGKDKNFLLKNEWALLAIIAANKWQRPICFNSTFEIEPLGIAKYVRQNGLAGQLVPVEPKDPYGSYNDDLAYNNMMTKFGYGNADIPGVYYDEENRRHLNTLRAAHAQLALSLIDEGKLDSARNLLEHFDSQVLESNFPYGMTSRDNEQDRISMSFLRACYRSNDLKLAAKVAASIRNDVEQQLRYYNSLGESQPNDQLGINAQLYKQGKGGNLAEQQQYFVDDILSSYQVLQEIGQMARQYGKAPSSPSGVVGPPK